MNKTAVCFISFNRPEYFAQCMASMALQRGSPDVDWYLFQDGNSMEHGRKIGSDDNIAKCIDIFKQTKLPGFREVRAYDYNIGIARNHYEATEYLFMVKGYEQIIVVEDDLVFSHDWLRLTHVLLDQFRDNKRIATVQASCAGGWNKALGEDKHHYSTAMCIGKPNWLGFAMWRDRWVTIRGTFGQYYEFVKKFPYHNRDHNAIRQWYRTSWGINETITSQDRAKDWSCFKHGMTRAFTRVNRAKYVGMYGVHGNPGNYAAGGYAKMTINDMPEDETLNRFDAIEDITISHYLEDIAKDKELFSMSCDGLINDR